MTATKCSPSPEKTCQTKIDVGVGVLPAIMFPTPLKVGISLVIWDSRALLKPQDHSH